jgi:hypothetical protein
MPWRKTEGLTRVTPGEREKEREGEAEVHKKNKAGSSAIDP